MSRSEMKRIAVQKGEPMPTFERSLRNTAIQHMKSAIGASFVEQMGWGESKPMAALQAYGIAEKQAAGALDALLDFLVAHTEEWMMEAGAAYRTDPKAMTLAPGRMIAALRGTTEEQ